MKLTREETKAELIKICIDNGIEVTSKKPTNTLLVDLIKSHPDYEASPTEDIPKLSEVPIDEIPGEVVDSAGNVLVKTTSKLDDITEDNERMIRVVITDHDTSQSIEDDQNNRLFKASWGNMLCTPRSEYVLVNGTPTGASRGMIKHMKALTTVIATNDAKGNPKSTKIARFSISEVDGWTEEQLEALKKTQAGRVA